MKKIISLFVVFLMMPFVLADENLISGNTKQIVEEKTKQSIETMNRGLNNALVNVKNSHAREVLQANIVKFQEHMQERLARLENLNVTNYGDEGEAKITAEEKVKVLGFINAKVDREFYVDKEGKTIEKKKWYDFMLKQDIEVN